MGSKSYPFLFMSNLGKYLAQVLLEDFPINEYSQGIINKLTAKFKQENPSLSDDDIKTYINRFDSIKGNLPTDKRDIMKYSWDELEQAVASSQSKRIKAGKINDGEPEDANLVYNQNGLRIYVAKTKQACIKYGNGYNFCISARGEDNQYNGYRIGDGGTPYFVFDDTKSSERDKNGKFIDPTHLLVIFRYATDEDRYPYTVTTADNPGEEEYGEFENNGPSSVVRDYPRLKGLENIFKLVGVDPKETAEFEIQRNYNGRLNDLNYDVDHGMNGEYYFSSIKWAETLIDNFINNKVEVYRFSGNLKPTVDIYNYASDYQSQDRLIKVGGKISVEDQKKEFIDFLTSTYVGSNKNHNIADDWIVTYKKSDLNNPIQQNYFEDVKELVDEYRKELAKIKLMKEGLESKPQRLNESQTATIGEFIKYACKDLGIQKFPSKLTLSYDTDAAREKRSFGYFDPNNNQIWVYVKNRNMADILRTLAHELVHRKQDEDGRIDYESGETGSDIENEANAKAGVLLRDYGKVDNGIYEAKEYGDHLFGGKDTGVSIKWYSSELEPDTPAEKSLFDFLHKYADSEDANYAAMNLDSYYDTFKLIKNEYPNIGDSRLLNSMYVYRGTIIDKDKLDTILKKEFIRYNPFKTIIIPDQTYSSSRKISSWSINYDTAHWFAINQKLSKYSKDPNKIPVVMRGVGKDTEPYFNMTFMNKLSNTNENEFLNAANPMPVDIMVLKKENWEMHSGGEDNNQMRLVYK
jgi:hypothetical protein